MGEQGIGLVVNDGYLLFAQHLIIIVAADRGSARHDHLVVFEMARGLDHGREVVLDLLLATACEQGDDGLFGEGVAREESFAALRVVAAKLHDFLGCRIADIVDGILVLLIERHLEGEDGEEFLDVTANGLDAPLLPGPYLRRDIVIDRYLRVLVDVAGYVEIEARIIDQDYYVGTPRHNVLLTPLHVAKDGAQVKQDGHKTHIGQVLVVAHAFAADGRHEVAAEEAKLRRGVILAQRGHQPAGVEVATCLAHYQIVLHIVRTSTSASIHSRSRRW